MGSKKSNIIFHDFYCINCGFKMTLPRKKGHQHERGHFKKCYCVGCQQVMNFFEIKDLQDKEEFDINFNSGAYLDLVKETINLNLTPTGLMEW